MFEIVLVLMCALGIAMLAVPIGITFGTWKGVAVAVVLSAIACIFVFGDQVGTRPGGDQTLAFHYDHAPVRRH